MRGNSFTAYGRACALALAVVLCQYGCKVRACGVASLQDRDGIVLQGDGHGPVSFNGGAGNLPVSALVFHKAASANDGVLHCDIVFLAGHKKEGGSGEVFHATNVAGSFKHHVIAAQRSGPALRVAVNGARGNGGRTQYAQACNAEVKLGIVLDIEGGGPCFRTGFDNGIRLCKGRVGSDLDVARNTVSIKVSGRAVEAGQVVLNGPVFLLACDQQQQRHQGYNSLHTAKVSNYAP